MLAALRARRGADRRAQRRRDRDRGAEHGRAASPKRCSRRATNQAPQGPRYAGIRRRAADVPGPRLRPARGLEERERTRRGRRTATRSCSSASTPNRARPRCSRSRATCWSTSAPPRASVYAGAKINAAYTIGEPRAGTDGGSLLAAETIEREVFPELTAERDRRRQLLRLHQRRRHARLRLRQRRPPLLQRDIGTPENYSSINLQPGYQKLCYKTRSTTCATATPTPTSCGSRASRTSCATCASRSDAGQPRQHRPGRQGRRPRDHDQPSPPRPRELIQLAKLIAFSQSKPAAPGEVPVPQRGRDQQPAGDYVTTTPELERATLREFLYAAQRRAALDASASHVAHEPAHRTAPEHRLRPAALDLVPTDAARAEAVNGGSSHVPFRVLYPHAADAARPNSSRFAPTRSATSRASVHSRLRGRLPAEHRSAATTTSRGPTG